VSTLFVPLYDLRTSGWDSLQVKKRDGTIEPFNRTKLRAGIERAVEKRDVSETTVTSLVDDIEARFKTERHGLSLRVLSANSSLRTSARSIR